MSRNIIILSVLLLVSACAQTNVQTATPAYHKDGMTKQQYSKDLADCQTQANVATQGQFSPGISGRWYQLSAVIQHTELCMAGRGYSPAQ